MVSVGRSSNRLDKHNWKIRYKYVAKHRGENKVAKKLKSSKITWEVWDFHQIDWAKKKGENSFEQIEEEKVRGRLCSMCGMIVETMGYGKGKHILK